MILHRWHRSVPYWHALCIGTHMSKFHFIACATLGLSGIATAFIGASIGQFSVFASGLAVVTLAIVLAGPESEGES